ncbi:unnamed protein product [Pleuronectes platessa]|uniref:Uncharacterized protein n=1 Tax=Pleuronectes platessa TaxID=8262 RepID=A0A9N7YDH3_PLEPL|nr:unnamed protein product [Pleuronectes platessa]
MSPPETTTAVPPHAGDLSPRVSPAPRPCHIQIPPPGAMVPQLVSVLFKNSLRLFLSFGFQTAARCLPRLSVTVCRPIRGRGSPTASSAANCVRGGAGSPVVKTRSVMFLHDGSSPPTLFLLNWSLLPSSGRF